MPRITLSSLTASLVLATLCGVAPGADSSHVVSDEGLRLATLHAIFPGMQIARDSNLKIDDSWPEKPNSRQIVFPDALANEQAYRVLGKAMNEAEKEASADIIAATLSDTRRVRLKVFRWPNENDDGLLAVLQYDFLGASPSMSCPSIGLLVHLKREAAGLKTRESYLLQTVHHTSLQRIELLDLSDVGLDELTIQSHSGGAGVVESSFQVFDLSHGRFDEVLNTDSRLEDSDQEGFTQVLDVRRTKESHGRRFCFSRSTLFEKGKWFSPPRVTRPCYRRGYLSDTGARERNRNMLAPVR